MLTYFWIAFGLGFLMGAGVALGVMVLLTQPALPLTPGSDGRISGTRWADTYGPPAGSA